MSKNILHIDFETRSACEIKKAGAYVYANHPSTDILCMGFAFNDEPVCMWRPEGTGPISTEQFKRALDHVNSGGEVVAHNAAFELDIWKGVGVRKYGWPSLSVEQTQCTMIMAYAMNLPGALEKASIAVGLEIKKDMAGNRVMMKLSQPKKDGSFHTPETSPEEFSKLYDYCAQDIEVERALHKRLVPLSEYERQVWILDQKINQRGIAIDIKSAQAAIQVIELEKERLNREMVKVTGNAVGACTNTGQLRDWIQQKGIEIPGVAKSDVTALLLKDDLPSDVRRALQLRQEAAKSSTAKLEAMVQGVSSDGRIRGIFQYYGATATGRWAGRRIQPQNFPRPNLKDEHIDRIFTMFEETT